MPESVADDTPCDLCGLPVKVAGVELKTAEGNKIFCCLGCKSLYTLIHGIGQDKGTGPSNRLR
jgi:hypothetical protein